MPDEQSNAEGAGGVSNSLGILLACLLLLAVVAYFAIPVMLRASASARRTADKSNLSQIGKALGMYAEVPANLGRFPDRLERLYPGFIDDPRVFQSPVVRSGHRRSGLDGVEFCDYFYLLPGGTDSHGTAMVAFGPAAANGEGRNLLLGAGSVEWVQESGFRKAILDQLESQGVSLAVHTDDNPEERRLKEALRKELGLAGAIKK